MKTLLALLCAMSLAWNVALTIQLRDFARVARSLQAGTEHSLSLAKSAEAKATALAIQARLIARNTTVILVQEGR